MPTDTKTDIKRGIGIAGNGKGKSCRSSSVQP